MRCENKPLLQDDPRFFQDITSTAVEVGLARKIRDFRNTEGLAMVQIRYRRGFETKNEAFT